MSERKEIKRPQHLIDKYGEDFQIWSYSRISNYLGCPHEFYLNKILKKEGTNSLWGILGGLSHQQLEDFYNGKIKYEDMLKKFETSFLDYEMADLKFVKDEDQNNRMVKKYKDCMVHFFKNHKPVQQKVLSEREVWVDTGIAGFIGYVDAIHKDEEGFYVITDYKTSSMGNEYKGVNLLHKQEQLLLYALALTQLGIPLDKIKIRWNFLKYTNIVCKHMVSVTYTKNGKEVTSTMRKDEMIKKLSPQLKKDIIEFVPGTTTQELKNIIAKLDEEGSISGLPSIIKDRYVIKPVVKTGERHKWVEAIKTVLSKDMYSYGMSDVDVVIEYAECLADNNLDSLPEEISKNYELEDCYVYGDVSKKNIDNLINNMNMAIIDIKGRGTHESAWQDNKLENDKTKYYCSNLCSMKSHCKFYSEYIEELKKQQEGYKRDIDILNELDLL
jgi:RecB family exonuclease